MSVFVLVNRVIILYSLKGSENNPFPVATIKLPYVVLVFSLNRIDMFLVPFFDVAKPSCQTSQIE